MTVVADSAFSRKGAVALRAACIELIESWTPDEGAMEAEAHAWLEERTQVEWTREAVLNQMRSATDDLLSRGRKGARLELGYGWVRMTDVDVMRWSDERDNRARRQVVRSATAVAVADPAGLPGEERIRRDAKLRVGQQLLALMGRRAQRLRPLPPELENESA
jgi:hypothetical protein